MKILDRIAQTIEKNNKFLIIAHNNLDGDSFGSGLALGLALKNMGKDANFLLKTPIPERYNFLPGIKEITTKIQDSKKYSVLFVLDTAGWDQIEGVDPSLFKNYTIINIDHHIDNLKFGSINWIDTRASAVGEQIYKLLTKLKIPITKEIASCIYTAILTDTGCFQFSNTTSDTYEIASKLLQKGALPSYVSEKIYERMPFRRLKLFQYALSSLKIGHNKKIIWMWVTQAMLKKSGAKREDTEGFIDYLKAVEGIKVAVIFKEEPVKNEISPAPPYCFRRGWVRVTLRSKDSKIFVNQIAHKFNGGGHPAAAGCTVQGTKKEVEKRVIEAIESIIYTNKHE